MRYRLNTMRTTSGPLPILRGTPPGFPGPLPILRAWAAGAILTLAVLLGLLGPGPVAAGGEPGAALAGAARPVSEQSVLADRAAPVAPLADRRGERERPGQSPVAVLAAATAGAALASRLLARSPAGRVGDSGRPLRAGPRGPPRLRPAWT